VERPGGFETVTRAAAAAVPVAPRTESTSRGLEIVMKPKPAYTDEARRRQIEGEVVLEAEFTAAGVVRVLRVVRGLGHGLDEAAVAAAQGIRFRPAEREGAAVSTVAQVRMVFQLAF
jgi:TonB family protein